MKWLSNIGDPKSVFAKIQLTRMYNETLEQAWDNHLRWLNDKIIGDPKPTEWYTVDQLKAMSMVGVYAADFL